MLPKLMRNARTREEAIPILRVSNAAESVRWYSRLGFKQEWEHRFEPGLPAFVSIERRGVRLFLSEHAGDARPETLVYIRVKNVSQMARDVSAQMTEQPWATEIYLTDPDGNRLRIGTPTFSD
jgi:catechol 2,3-dioxygenase-like lactoylglutathione lyase family enzyme